MIRDGRNRLEELLEGALEREPKERSRFLAEVCPDEPDLRGEVESILAGEAGSGPFDRLFDAFSEAPSDGCPDGIGPGDRLGPYEVERLLGRGGMGSVFLARRADGQFEQEVAIKLLRRDAAGEEPQRHFLAERQILARLSHPSIARVFDGGVTPRGQPYLVMERVEGTPIDRYCDERRLGVRERLLLFTAVCEGVHYAHQNLVVHRDLKPGNILVTADGRPKLLDFGVAKLLAEADGGQTLTGTGWLPMTPDYASPEQVRGDPITTASDVYALGALLYELLSGHRPHRFARKPPAEILRVLSEAEPLPPSAAVGRVAEVEGKEGEAAPVTPETVCRARATDPQALKRRLQGDLDTIVLKALRKEPERRYAGAGELALDIERHLQGLPVRARPDTAGYRLSKFVRRHRAAAALAASILLSLAVLAATMTVQADRVARERDRAERVSELLSDVFAGADPTVVPGEELTAREALDRGVERLRATPAVGPKMRARLLGVIAQAYQNLGALDRAIELDSEAVAMLRPAVPAEDPLFLRTIRNLADYRVEVGQYDEAKVLLREALDIARTLGPRRAPELAEVLNSYGLVWHASGDYAAARPFYEEALSLYRSLPSPSDSSMEETLANLGWVAHASADWETAESRLREVLELRRARLGAEHPVTARTMLALSDVLLRQERVEGAQPLATAALSIVRASYPDPHPELADALGANAKILARQGRFAEAEAHQREALAIYRELYGDEHATVAYGTNDLAWQLDRQGRLDEATALFREATARFTALLGEVHPFTAVIRTNVAWAEHRRGRSAEAEALYRRAVPVLDSAWAGTPSIARTLVDFAIVLMENRKSAEAEPLLRRALELERGEWPPAHERVIRPQRHLGACLVNLGRFQEAEPLLLDAYRELLAGRGGADPDVVEASQDLVRLYELSGRDELAARYRRIGQ